MTKRRLINISFQATPELYEKIKRNAQADDRSVAAFIRRHLDQNLKTIDNEAKPND